MDKTPEFDVFFLSKDDRGCMELRRNETATHATQYIRRKRNISVQEVKTDDSKDTWKSLFIQRFEEFVLFFALYTLYNLLSFFYWGNCSIGLFRSLIEWLEKFWHCSKGSTKQRKANGIFVPLYFVLLLFLFVFYFWWCID